MKSSENFPQRPQTAIALHDPSTSIGSLGSQLNIVLRILHSQLLQPSKLESKRLFRLGSVNRHLQRASRAVVRKYACRNFGEMLCNNVECVVKCDALKTARRSWEFLIACNLRPQSIDMEPRGITEVDYRARTGT
jgi:hypothetical protein